MDSKIIGFFVAIALICVNIEARNQTLGYQTQNLLHQERITIESNWFRVKTYVYIIPSNTTIQVSTEEKNNIL